MADVTAPDWASIPAPVDDGAAAHLAGMDLPPVSLQATTGGTVDLSALPGLTVVYVYPLTGHPDREMPKGWDMIPGARGCSPQSCAFRDHAAELRDLGVGHLFGLSAQSTAYQAEAAERLHLPFALLSDESLEFADELDLPQFEAGGQRLLKRITLILRDGRIEEIFYPVFPPDQNAQKVIDWLAGPDGRNLA
jgi:peroxiredoxin